VNEKLRDTGSKLAQKERELAGLESAKRDLENQIKRLAADRDTKDEELRREQDKNRINVAVR
jgi:septal ring factor EnvC (AmiA/AmiB activator)